MFGSDENGASEPRDHRRDIHSRDIQIEGRQRRNCEQAPDNRDVCRRLRRPHGGAGTKSSSEGRPPDPESERRTAGTTDPSLRWCRRGASSSPSLASARSVSLHPRSPPLAPYLFTLARLRSLRISSPSLASARSVSSPSANVAMTVEWREEAGIRRGRRRG